MSGDDYPKTVGLSPKFKKHNRFANITVCKCIATQDSMYVFLMCVHACVKVCYNLFVVSTDDHNRIVLNPIPGHNFQGDFINGCYVDVSWK